MSILEPIQIDKIKKYQESYKHYLNNAFESDSLRNHEIALNVNGFKETAKAYTLTEVVTNIRFDINNTEHQRIFKQALLLDDRSSWKNLSNKDKFTILDLISARKKIVDEKADWDKKLYSSLSRSSYLGSSLSNLIRHPIAPAASITLDVAGMYFDYKIENIEYGRGISTEDFTALGGAEALINKNDINAKKLLLYPLDKSALKDLIALQFKSSMEDRKDKASLLVKHENLTKLIHTYARQNPNLWLQQAKINEDMQQQMSMFADFIDYYLKEQEKAKNLQETMAVFQGVQNCFALIGYIDNKHAQRIASIGQNTVGLFISVAKLTGSFGFTAATGWAMIEPISGIALCALGAIFTLSKKKGSESAFSIIASQIQALFEEIRKGFQEMSKRFDIIDNTLFDIKLLMADGFANLHAELRRQSIINREEHRVIHLKDFRQLLFLAKRSASDQASHITATSKLKSIDQKKQTKLKNEQLSYLNELTFWLLEGSHSPLLNGCIHLKGNDIGDEAKWLTEVLTSDNQISLLGYLGGYVERLLQSELPYGIKPELFFNPAIWSESLGVYVILLKKLNSQGHIDIEAESCLDEVLEQADNLLRFIQFLQKDNKLYLKLFDTYDAAIKQINDTIRNRFKIKRNEVPYYSPGGVQNIDRIFLDHTGERLQLNKLLSTIDASMILLKTYAQLAGLKLNFNNLYDSKKILNTRIDMVDNDAHCPMEGLPNQGNKPQYCDAFKTQVVQYQGQPYIYTAAIRDDKGLRLFRYNPVTQANWESEFTILTSGALNNKNPHYIRTFNTAVLNINSQPHMVAIICTPAGTELYAYRVEKNHSKTQPWIPLKIGPQPSSKANEINQKGYNTFKSIVIQHNNEQKLLCCWLEDDGLNMHLYSPISDVWQPLKTGRLDKNKYKEAACYETLQIHTVNDNKLHQTEGLLVLLHDGTNMQTYFYNIKNNIWENRDSPALFNHVFHRDECRKTLRSELLMLPDGEHQVIVMMRDHARLVVAAYSFEKNFWHLVIPGSPYMRDNHGYAEALYYESLKTSVIKKEGKEVLFMTFRTAPRAVDGNGKAKGDHFEYWHFEPKSNYENNVPWHPLIPQCGPHIAGYINHPDLYKTMQAHYLEVEGNKKILISSLAADTAKYWMYTLEPAQLEIDQEIRNKFLNMKEIETQPSNIEKFLSTWVHLIESSKISLNPGKKFNNPGDEEPPTIQPNPCNGQNSRGNNNVGLEYNSKDRLFKRRLDVLVKHICPEEKRFQPNEEKQELTDTKKLTP